jgi:hypothetical protein
LRRRASNQADANFILRWCDMNKITIDTIRRAINDCPEMVGKLIEITFNDDDAIEFMHEIRAEITRNENAARIKATSEETV